MNLSPKIIYIPTRSGRYFRYVCLHPIPLVAPMDELVEMVMEWSICTFASYDIEDVHGYTPQDMVGMRLRDRLLNGWDATNKAFVASAIAGKLIDPMWTYTRNGSLQAVYVKLTHEIRDNHIIGTHGHVSYCRPVITA